MLRYRGIFRNRETTHLECRVAAVAGHVPRPACGSVAYRVASRPKVVYGHDSTGPQIAHSTPMQERRRSAGVRPPSVQRRDSAVNFLTYCRLRTFRHSSSFCHVIRPTGNCGGGGCFTYSTQKSLTPA